MVECVTCGGTFEPIQNGQMYFHVCPPLSVREIRAGLDAGTVRLRAEELDRLAAARDADVAAPVGAGLPSREDQVLARLTIDRPDARNENVVEEIDGATRRTRIKAEGRGVRPVRLR